DALLLALIHDQGAEDRLLLLDGETLTGLLTAAPRAGRFIAENAPAGADAFEMIRRGAPRPLAIPAAKVVAVSFSVAAQRPLHAAGPSAWLGLREGSCVHASSISTKSGKVTLSLAVGGELNSRLAARGDKENAFWDAATYIQPVNARVNWLAQVEAISYRQIPFLTVQRQFSR